VNAFRARRHRITILQKNGSTWNEVCQTWAEIHHENLITIRYQPDLQPGYRVVIGNSFFEIVGVIDRPGKTRLVELRIEKLRASTDSLGAL